MLNLKEWLNTEECFSITALELRESQSDLRRAFVFIERLSQKAPRYAPSVKSLYDDYLSDKEEEEREKQKKQRSLDVEEPDDAIDDDEISTKEPEQEKDDTPFRSFSTVYFTSPRPSQDTRLYLVLGKGLYTRINPNKKPVRFQNPQDFKKYNGKVFNSYGKELFYDEKNKYYFHGPDGQKIMGSPFRNEPFFFDEFGRKVDVNGSPIADPNAEKTTAPEAKKTTAPEAKKIAEPEAKKTTAPEAKKIAEPEAKKTSAPEAKKTSAPEAKKTSAPEAKKTSAPDSAPMPAPPSSPAPVENKTKEQLLQKLANELLGGMNTMLTKMIGKTLSAYKNKDSDAYSRAAITLDNYKKGLGDRYKKWILTNWFGRKVESVEALDEAYSLNDYRNLMYQKAAQYYASWLDTPAISTDLETIKNQLRAVGRRKKLDLKQGEMEVISRGEPTLQDLSQFVNMLIKQQSPAVDKRKVMNIKLYMDSLSPEEYQQFLKEQFPKLRELIDEMENQLHKKPSALSTIGVAGAAATAIAGAISGGSLLVVGAINTLLAMYHLYKEKSTDDSKKVIAERYLKFMNQEIANLGKKVAARYVGK